MDIWQNVCGEKRHDRHECMHQGLMQNFGQMREILAFEKGDETE